MWCSHFVQMNSDLEDVHKVNYLIKKDWRDFCLELSRYLQDYCL